MKNPVLTATFFFFVFVLFHSTAWAGATLTLDKERLTIEAKAHLIFYGDITEEKAASISHEVESLWSGRDPQKVTPELVLQVTRAEMTEESPENSNENNSAQNSIQKKYQFFTTITHEVLSEQKARASAAMNHDVSVNYILVETGEAGDRSHVSAIGANTAVFYQNEALGKSTVAAHEFGHLIGLPHSDFTDFRHKGRPAVMCTYGTIVDPEFQIDPKAEAGMPGGTIALSTRRVLQDDLDMLKLEQLPFQNGHEILGKATNKVMAKE